MKDLSEIRVEIDEIDNSIYDLFLKRLSLSNDVAEYKLKNNLNVFDKKRENEKLFAVSQKNDDALIGQSMVELFSHIMSISKKKQYRLLAEAGRMKNFDFIKVQDFDYSNATVVYQGVEGAYSQQAMLDYFGEISDSFHVKTFRDAMEALVNDKADFAVVPIENSSAGSVSENYDLLYEYDVAITGEQIVNIEHSLLGLKGATLSDIDTVYSHPQGLMQCDKYLREHPDWKTISLENTAVSAKRVKSDGLKNQAAIAGEINARLYGLEVLDNKIQDAKNNKTRFFILTKKHIYLKDADTVTICFSLADEEGSLYKSLSHFAFNGLNMTRIESRPIKDRQWEYRFFVDFTGNLADEAVINALHGLAEETDDLKILGNY